MSRATRSALTGEGADEALAGYVWHKTQAGREWLARHGGSPLLRLIRAGVLGSIGGGSAHRPPVMATRGTRVAQQDLFDFVGQARMTLYSREMWDRLGDHDPYDDLDLDNPRMTRWNPLNQSLYVGYKVLLAGHMLISKADRVMMRSSVEGRYPFLDEDVIDFCAGLAPEYKVRGLTDKWLLRQVAARMLPPRIANRPKTMFRAKLSQSFLRPPSPGLGGPASEPRVAASRRLLRPAGRRPRAGRAGPLAPAHPTAVHLRRGLDQRGGDPALASPVLRRWPLRPARMVGPGTPVGKRPPRTTLGGPGGCRVN